MSTIAHEQDNTAELSEARAAVAGALKDAPQGRHAQEKAALEAAQEQLTGKCSPAVKADVDAFFATQRDQLGKLQQAELDLINGALDASSTQDLDAGAQQDALRVLAHEVDSVGAIHQEEHARLARERADLETALSLANKQEQSAAIGELRQQQAQADGALQDTLDAAKAFAEGPDQLIQEADNPTGHKRANLGEKLATDWLAAEGYDILNFKPSIKDTTRPGIDMVAMKDDTVYLLDNKALRNDDPVYSVTALTKNLEKNLSNARSSLEDMANDQARTAEEIAVARKALEALDAERYVLAVTNANFTEDDLFPSDVSERLKREHDIEFIDVMKGKKT